MSNLYWERIMTVNESSLFSSVYENIKTKILHLEYRPGRPLSVATLAESLGVSRTPVHDAIIKLSNESLVDVFPKSGSRVSLIDIKRTEDERFIRKSLELSAIKEMFYYFDETYLVKMEQCIQEHEKAFKEGRLIDTLYWDGQFHSQIFASIGKEYCWQVSMQYQANEFRVRLLAEKAIVTTQESVIQNHLDMVKFLRERNLNAVLEIADQHLSRIYSELARLVVAMPELFTRDTANIAPSGRVRAKEDYNENFLETIEHI